MATREEIARKALALSPEDGAWLVSELERSLWGSIKIYYQVTGWHEAADGSMRHTQTWTFDNRASVKEKREEIVATAEAFTWKGEGLTRKPFSIRFELVIEKVVNDDRDFVFEFLEELWFANPVPPDWHII